MLSQWNIFALAWLMIVLEKNKVSLFMIDNYYFNVVVTMLQTL